MPVYEFKCNCGRKQEIILSFSEYKEGKFGLCKKCNKPLVKSNQQINFNGYVTMISPVTKVHRRYSNKGGGPKPIIDGKIRQDLKMPGA